MSHHRRSPAALTVLAVLAYCCTLGTVLLGVVVAIASYVMADRVTLPVSINTAARPELPGLTESQHEAAFRTAQITITDPATGATWLFVTSVLLNALLIAGAFLLVGLLLAGLSRSTRLFSSTAASGITIFGLVCMIEPIIVQCLRNVATAVALDHAGLTSSTAQTSGADALAAPGLTTGLFSGQMLFSLAIGAFLVIVGLLMRRARVMETELEDVV